MAEEVLRKEGLLLLKLADEAESAAGNGAVEAVKGTTMLLLDACPALDPEELAWKLLDWTLTNGEPLC